MLKTAEDMAGMETNDSKMRTSGVVDILGVKLDAVILYWGVYQLGSACRIRYDIALVLHGPICQALKWMPFYRNIHTEEDVLWKAA